MNSEPLLEAFLDYENLGGSTKEKHLVYGDSWKSCRPEREELLNFIEEHKINGVVSLSGDYHINIAATVASESQKNVLADFAVPALSSFPDHFWLDRRGKGAKNEVVYSLYSYKDEEGNLLPNINTSVLYGAHAAREMAKTGSFQKAKKKLSRKTNPHVQYFDCQYNGYISGRFG